MIAFVDPATDDAVLGPGLFGHEPVATVEALVDLDDRHPLDRCLFHTIYKTYMYINLLVLEYICCMTAITVYLSNELYDKVRDAPSKTVRAALEYYFKESDGKTAATSEGPPRDTPGRKEELIS